MSEPASGRVPTSTYRLQISEEFDLFEATARLEYLHDLGVDWVYLSPLLAAEPAFSISLTRHLATQLQASQSLDLAPSPRPETKPPPPSFTDFQR